MNAILLLYNVYGNFVKQILIPYHGLHRIGHFHGFHRYAGDAG